MNENRERLALVRYKKPRQSMSWYRKDRIDPAIAPNPEMYHCDVGKDDRYLERLRANHPERAPHD